MGIGDPNTLDGLRQGEPETKDQAKLLLMLLFINQYQDHGRNVFEVMRKTADFLGLGRDPYNPNQVSIASAVKFGEVEFDELGNPTMQVNISQEAVEKLISQNPESIINMSFELGEFSVTYEWREKKLKYPEMANQGPSKTSIGETTSYKDYLGNPITEEKYRQISERMDETIEVTLDPTERDVEFLDGYASEHAYENLRKLAQIAKKHPEKMFIAAGGNPSSYKGETRIPDITEARIRLEQEGLWGNNLIMAGFTGYPGVGFESAVQYETRGSYGSDIYVSSNNLQVIGYRGASSYATPLITMIGRQLVLNGSKTHNMVTEELLKMTEVKEAWSGPEKIEYRVLSQSRAKEVVASPLP